MSGKFLARASAMSLALLLAACGGGGDGSTPLSGISDGEQNSDGGTSNPGTPSTPGDSSTVDSLRLVSSQPTIGTSGTATATITAIVKDENSVLVEGEPVTFRIPEGDGTILNAQNTTSEQGVATATLSAEGDFRNRTITVEATAGEITQSVNIQATGTRLLITGPSNISLGDSVDFNISLVDSDDRGIPGETVSVTAANNGVNAAASTNLSGQITATLTAQSSGQSSLVASAFNGDEALVAEKAFVVSGESFTFTSPNANAEIELGATPAVEINWTNNGTPVNGEDIQFTIEKGNFVQSGTNTYTTTVNSGTATANITSTESGKARLQARALDSDLTTSTEIEFVATTPAALKLNATKSQLLVGESSDISVVVRDAQGNLVKNANVTFGLSDVTGGRLTALEDITDTSGTARTSYISGTTATEKDKPVVITASVSGGISDNITLTVGGQALTIIIGTGNTLQPLGEVFYSQPWGIQVTDVNGNSVGNQRVDLSVLPVEYRKGFYVDTKTDPDEYLWEPNYTANCQPQDAGGTDPNVANPASVPSTVFTDANGKFEFGIEYTKAQCSWAKVKITATAEVEGEASSSTQTFTLPCLNDDLTSSMPPGGVESFYGETADCSTNE
ncbi:Ig-like domain-containing protein [Marinobacter nauticus]|uniref:Ig-like domain-containing protein n=1 Tax=Marinobacter nauticus TaxID=2743 RepID=UPI001D182FFF|nr:Ig-like domain-containing protein [Marinobacter nauticus]MCC4272579.1 Ig-like domain-containing protein [Marinobacter nauticus]